MVMVMIKRMTPVGGGVMVGMGDTINKEVNGHLDRWVRSQMAVICSLILRFQIADDDDGDDGGGDGGGDDGGGDDGVDEEE